jgi:hypothetical protein
VQRAAQQAEMHRADHLGIAALAIAATLIRTQLADAVTLLGGVALVGVGVALVGDGMAVLADHHLPIAPCWAGSRASPGGRP